MTAPGGGEVFNLSVNIDPSGAQTGAQTVIRQLQQIQQAQQGQLVASAQMAKGYGQVGNSLQSLARYAAVAKAAIIGFVTTSAIRNVADLAARYETLGVVMNTAGKAAGYSAGQLDVLERKLRVTGITMAQSRQSIVSMMQAQLDLTQASKLARAAQDVAVVAGLNSSQTLQRMMHGIVAGQTEVLRTIGLGAVTFESSYKKMADSIGKTVEQLTGQERVQARVNAVMKAAEPLAGTYAAAMGTAGKQLQSMKRYVEDLKTSLGTLLLPAFTKTVFTLSGALGTAQKNLSSVTTFIGVVMTAAIVAATAKIGFAVAGLIVKLGGLKLALAALAGHPVILGFMALAGVIGVVATRSARVQAERMDQMEAWKKGLDKVIEKYDKLIEKNDLTAAKVVQNQLIGTYNATMAEARRLQDEVNRIRAGRSDEEIAAVSGVTGLGHQVRDAERRLAEATERFEMAKGQMQAMNLVPRQVGSTEPPAPTGLTEEAVKQAEEAKQRVQAAFAAMRVAKDEFFDPGPAAQFRREATAAIEDFAKAAKVAFPKDAAMLVETYTAQWKEFNALRIAKSVSDAERELSKETSTLRGLVAATKEGVDAIAEYNIQQRIGAEALKLNAAGESALLSVIKAGVQVRAQEGAARDLAIAKYDEERAAQDRLIAASQRGAKAYEAEARTQSIHNRAIELATQLRIKYIEAVVLATTEVRRAEQAQGQQAVQAYKAETEAIRKQIEQMGLSTEAIRKRAREREIEALMALKTAKQITRAEAEAMVDERLRLQQQGQEMARAMEERRVVAENFMRGMQQTVSDFFDQLFSGTLNSLDRFVDAVVAAFTRMVAEIASKAVMGKLQGVLQGAFTQRAGAAAGVVMVPGAMFGTQGPVPMPTPAQQTGTNWGGVGMAALGAGLVGYGAGQAGGAGMGIMAGGLSGAAMGFAAGGPPGMIVGAVVGMVGGLLGASKRAKEAAKQMEEARKNFVLAMDAYVRAANGTNNALSDALRQNEQQRLDLLKQADAAYAGKKNEERRNAERARVDATAAKNAARIVDDFIRGLSDSVAELKAPGGIAQREEALRRAHEADIEAAKAINDVTKRTEALRLANEKYALSVAELQRQLEEQRTAFAESLAIRAARARGDERGAVELELAASRRQELAAAEQLVRAGIITIAMFEQLAAVLDSEVTKALEDYDKAKRAESASFMDEQRARQARARGNEQEAQRIERDAQRRQELERARQLDTEALARGEDALHESTVRLTHSLEDAARAAAKAAERREFDEDLEVRRLRAEGKDREADERAFRNRQARERQEFLERFGPIGVPDPRNLRGSDLKRWLELNAVQSKELERFLRQQAGEGAMGGGGGGGGSTTVAPPVTIEGPIIIQVHFHGDVATTDINELARDIAAKVAPEVDRALGYQLRAQQRRAGSAIA